MSEKPGSCHGFSADISATLLFLISGYFADAAESAKELKGTLDRAESQPLPEALHQLGAGKFKDLVESELPAVDSRSSILELLGRELVAGIRGLAASLVGEAPASVGLPDDFDSRRWFQRIADLTVYSGECTGSELLADIEYTMSGPHQLALLLREAADSLSSHSVLQAPPPTPQDDQAWSQYLRRVAEVRPLLWRNHLDAVRDGFHKQGCSAVVTFPTGAGKSTIAELKIASALVCEKKVVYLAPTHALVGQITTNIGRAFPTKTVRNSSVSEGFYVEVEASTLPDVLVATPERCLTLLSVWPATFRDVGLIVFDECHLMHPRDLADRRALDAAFCLLHLLRQSNSPDVMLVSAMVDNAEELASWLEDVLETNCCVLDDPWKPTRQARGCVVYFQERIDELDDFLADAKDDRSTQAPPKAVKEELSASPFALLSLCYQWSRDLETFERLGLLEQDVLLTANKRWELTANRNKVAGALAQKFAKCGLKTLVFAQQISWAGSAAREAAELLEHSGMPEVPLNDTEKKWLQSAIDELGSEEHVILPTRNRVAIHHGLQIEAERRLNESIFARENGAKILVATSTLAQGMNLPAEVVVISGDDRFDKEADARQSLEAHELLNAAGRAGRAGFSSQGLVLLVPAAVIGLEPSTRRPSKEWFDLQERVFSQSDQCLSLADPIELLLDSIEDGNDVRLDEYFVHRMPLGGDVDGFFSASLAAYHAKTKGAQREFRKRLEELEKEKRRRLVGDGNVDQIATAVGTSPKVIASLAAHTDELAQNSESVGDVVQQLGSWLKKCPEAIEELIDVDELQTVTNGVEAVASDADRIDVLIEGCLMWMRGLPLCEIELFLGTAKGKLKTCECARKLTQHLLRGVSYGAGWVALIERVRREVASPVASPVPLHISTAGACVRGGFDRPEKLAVSMYARSRGRVACHQFFEEHRQRFLSLSEVESLEQVYEILNELSDVKS